MKLFNKNNRGFTLIELLVVVAIISLLSSVVMASLNTARAKARDAKRFSDLHQIQTALEMYYNDHGSYPLPLAGYTMNPPYPPGTTAAGNYNYASHPLGCANVFPVGTTSGANAYIQGLTPTYIPVLPSDPGGNSVSDCDMYISNGADYVFIEYKTIEGNVPASLISLGGPLSATILSPGAVNW
jgi:prepilin-type N-terminal cleavage/methylation domain-containing protein